MHDALPTVLWKLLKFQRRLIRFQHGSPLFKMFVHGFVHGLPCLQLGKEPSASRARDVDEVHLVRCEREGLHHSVP